MAAAQDECMQLPISQRSVAMSDYIDINTPDGSFHAYRVLPAVTPAPVVVVLQEIFGINADMKETCRWLAQQGFIALCPDLFWRDEPGLSPSSWTESEWKKGLQLYQAYDRDRGVADVAATMEVGRRLPQASGKVGVMGFCLGGLMTFLTAARTGADAAVSYYGGETDKYTVESAAIRTPLLMHLGEEDEFIPPAARQKIVESVQGNARVQVHTYPGCMHAFARHNGTHYVAAAAEQANARTIGFLKAQLG
jgi:carboxymethylenebutenolidase